jgi:integrase
MTFKRAAGEFYKLNEKKWSANHPFLVSLETYAFPVIGNIDVKAITTDDVLRVVQPLWTEKTETMRKVRSRIDAVMAWTIATGKRQTSNPAIWKGLLSAILPSPNKVAKVQHLPALPFAEAAAFMAELRQLEGTAARALELTVLTAVRTNEALGARWSEIDLDAATWTIPAERTKTGSEQRVPLSSPVLALLRALPTEDGNDYVFIGRVAGSRLGSTAMADVVRSLRKEGVTVHGFRSTFRDWAAETTGHDNHVVEMALGHAIGSDVEKAYRRGDLLAKRVVLMSEWAAYCDGAAAVDNVVPLRATIGG